jgi:hypothetical protein
MDQKPQSQEVLKRTPSDVSEFEREQLRFLLSEDDLARTLATVNPSLAWLPVLRSMQLIKDESQLFAWIERNLGDTRAVQEVVANIHFFGAETANFLEYRVNRQAADLPPLLRKSWRLLVRQMRSANLGLLQNEWFEIEPRVAQGEHSTELLERIAEVVRPKLTVGKLISLSEEHRGQPEQPSDLMSIDYEVDDHITADEVLKAWPVNASGETDNQLIARLTFVLEAALADATEVGVEGNEGYGTSDSDVPSIAQHVQNEHRSGFQVIVRLMAELWSRLAAKSSTLALSHVVRWRASQFRLVRRLALFASADPIVPATVGADLLAELPSGELFLTNSSVETYRLIRARWRDFSEEERQTILSRLREGPPRNWFREGAEVERHIDRSRFEILGEMERSGLEIGDEARRLLREIETRWPKWQLKPAEQAGFSIWHESVHGIVGDAGRLKGIADEELIPQAKRIAASAGFLDGDAWQALCLGDPDRAARGLDYAATKGDWTPELWRQLLWARGKYVQEKTVPLIARLLISWPSESFNEIADAAAAWLERANDLDDALLWPIWKRIADAFVIVADEESDGDVFTEALNSPIGRLTEIVIRKLRRAAVEGNALAELCGLLDGLIEAPGKKGKLARIRLSAEVSYLFEIVPEWTVQRIVPLFDWSSADTADAWEARKYSNYIGSPELVALTKKPFLELFGRREISAEDLGTFAEWITTILLANQSRQGDRYDLTGAEARAALRRAGVSPLPSVAHRLAIEMKKAQPGDEVNWWRAIVGPVFKAIWPLDVELQSHASTFHLVQILLASGEAFPEAADVIVPFIRPEARSHTAMYSIANAPDSLFASSPAKMLDLVAAVAGEPSVVNADVLNKALSRIRSLEPGLASTRKFQKLTISTS